MRYKILFFLSTLLFLSLFSFQNAQREPAYIYWGERPLTWDDFNGRAPSSSPYVALTWSAIKFSYSSEGNTMDMNVETVFEPKQSWKKKNVDEFVLKHEQGHFDITEIHARLLRKTLSETKFKKFETFGTEVQKIFDANFNACNKMQDGYDKETDHSKIKDEQLRWDIKIEEELKKLSGFSSTNLKIDIGYLLK